MKSGFVALVGRPNVGKSTLINKIIDKKVAITSNKAQTTRNIIHGVYNEEGYQMVFVDTPGIHKPINKLGQVLNKQAYLSIGDVDVVLFLVDASLPLGKGDKFIIENLKNIDKPVFLLLNKIDKITNEEILNKINEYKDLYNFKEIIPISAYKKTNIKDLINTLKKYLTDNIMYYGEDMYTNVSTGFIITETIREKVLELTREEIPHSVTCVLDTIEEDNYNISISASIIVDRENIKKIIIGKQGSMIKNIGIRARKELEVFLDKKIYLELFVKVVPKWRDKEKFLNEQGYEDFLNKN